MSLIDPSEGASSSDKGECSAPDKAAAAAASNSSGVEEIQQLETIECSVELTDDAKASTEDIQDGNSIRIKLKYLNDDLKVVDGQLSELLGEFKRYKALQ